MAKQKQDPEIEGTVKWFDEKKGYGFIEVPGRKEVFVHYSGIEGERSRRTLNEGDRVRFLLGQGKKGPSATNVRVI